MRKILLFLGVLILTLGLCVGIGGSTLHTVLDDNSITYKDEAGKVIMTIDHDIGVTIPTYVIGDTYTSITVTATTEADSTTVGSIITPGGIACAKQLNLGGDLVMSEKGTGTYDITLRDSVADALTIVRGSTDMVVFNTDSPAVTTTADIVYMSDSASYVTTTVADSGTVLVEVTGDGSGSYEIQTDDLGITLDAANNITLDAGSGDVDIISDVRLLTDKKVEFRNGATYIQSTDANDLAIVADATLIVTSPVTTFVVSTSVIFQDNALSYLTTTVADSGAVKVNVTGDGSGSYEIQTDDGYILLDAANNITLSPRAGDVDIESDVLLDTTKKVQFFDTGMYINASSDGSMVISSDDTLEIGATDSCVITSPVTVVVAATSHTITSPVSVVGAITSHTVTSPAVKFIATTSVVHEYDSSAYVTTTVTDSGVVKVAVTGDTHGTYEIETDSGEILLDAYNNITLDAGTGDVDFLDDALFATTKKVQFHDTGMYINATSDGSMAISSDGTLAIGATDSCTVTATVIGLTGVTTITGATTIDGAVEVTGVLTSDVGIVVKDGYAISYGTDSDVVVRFDSGEAVLVTLPKGNFVSPEGMSNRFRLEWVAGQRGKPGINSDVDSTAIVMITDHDFEILGLNASSDDVSFYDEGGIVLETDGPDSNEVILLPHLDANQSAWEQVTWGTDNEVRWETYIRTTASVDSCIIWAGLKLTNTEVVATDSDELYFRYENLVNDGEWLAITNVHGGGVDSHDTNVVVTATTNYHLVIELDDTGIAKYYIDGALVETGTTFAANHADLIPYIGVAAEGTTPTARSIIIRGQVISREYD